MATPKSRRKAEAPNLELIDEILNWAAKNGSSNDAVITELVSDLRELSDLDAWASLPTIELLPSINAPKADRKVTLANRIAIVRNILVFVPVALTWIAVSKATGAFGEYTTANKGAVVNFLEFWQNGYDVLDEKWRISTVALTDALIVFIVIFLSVGATYLADLANDRSQEEDSVLLEERAELALAIKEYLYTKQTVTRLTLNQGIATAIENLVEATENLQKRRRK